MAQRKITIKQTIKRTVRVEQTITGWISKRSIQEHEEEESKYAEATP